jgi:hypothetical protein
LRRHVCCPRGYLIWKVRNDVTPGRSIQPPSETSTMLDVCVECDHDYADTA